MRELERRVVLSVIGRKWQEHLYEMDYLKEGIGLRAMAQRDPLVEYQREGFVLFQGMMEAIREESVGFLFNLEVEVTPAQDVVVPDAAGGHTEHVEPQVKAAGLEAPEKPAQLPIECDANGNAATGDAPIKHFKDNKGRIKRQAARFQIFVYDAANPQGVPLKIGDHVEGGGNRGKLVDIQWRVQLANKKAAWFTFENMSPNWGFE